MPSARVAHVARRWNATKRAARMIPVNDGRWDEASLTVSDDPGKAWEAIAG